MRLAESRGGIPPFPFRESINRFFRIRVCPRSGEPASPKAFGASRIIRFGGTPLITLI